MSDYYLVHHGIPGQKWGVRRFQNQDGSLTTEGKRRYGVSDRRPSVPSHGDKQNKVSGSFKTWKDPFKQSIRTVRAYQGNRNARWDKTFNALSLDKADYKNRVSYCSERASYYRNIGNIEQARYYDELTEKWENEYEKADKKMEHLYKVKGQYWVEDKILSKVVSANLKVMRSDSFIAKSANAIDKGRLYVKKIAAKIFGPNKKQSGVRR